MTLSHERRPRMFELLAPVVALAVLIPLLVIVATTRI